MQHCSSAAVEGATNSTVKKHIKHSECYSHFLVEPAVFQRGNLKAAACNAKFSVLLLIHMLNGMKVRMLNCLHMQF